ncbi:sensor histidine kinase [Streptococcus sp. DD13]|uniref:sensor histidine kinase n=1 Tax=Streptococcus sp. DD13 TaxID=1777881 RepID=UPI000792B39D|nr:HAMP domain-containing sensor histidine kinase [Streptococcus sp. DD13]KXT78345.1 Regulation of D-alanyl-lipoteichoic acid biosynthesis, sensor histidine kinase [Streptococcus sp. DD13]
MLNRLRWQFTGIVFVAVGMILLLFVGIFNYIRWSQNDTEIRQALQILSDYHGSLPSEDKLNEELAQSSLNVAQFQTLQYISLLVNKEQTIASSSVDTVKSQEPIDLTRFLDRINLSRSKGYFTYQGRSYAYQLTPEKAGTLVVVLDITNYQNSQNQMIYLSIQMMATSLIFVLVIVFIFSGRAIRPYIRNAENQKRFITNAGHELKTPLAIISANTEMEEMLNGESEWSKSTKDQVQRLTRLINQMVTLSKMEEQPDLILSDCNLSEVTQDAAEDFKALVTKDGKGFKLDIQPNLQVKAEEKSLFELVTILVDNANKYCDEKGLVHVRVYRNRLRKPVLEVSNTYKDGDKVDYSRFFDRFYREDESRNSQVDGFGIGLSMAQSMVRLFRGRMSAHYKGDRIFFRVTF